MTEELHQTQSVYSSEISIADAINTAAMYKETIKNIDCIESQETSHRTLFNRVAEVIKSDIRTCNDINIHPLDPNDVSLKNVNDLIPATLREFLLLFAVKTKKSIA